MATLQDAKNTERPFKPDTQVSSIICTYCFWNNNLYCLSEDKKKYSIMPDHVIDSLKHFTVTYQDAPSVKDLEIPSQPKPIPNNTEPVGKKILQDIRDRIDLGEKKYGVALQIDNGRSFKQDKYEELLDLLFYTKGDMLEEEEITKLLETATGEERGNTTLLQYVRDKVVPHIKELENY